MLYQYWSFGKPVIWLRSTRIFYIGFLLIIFWQYSPKRHICLIFRLTLKPLNFKSLHINNLIQHLSIITKRNNNFQLLLFNQKYTQLQFTYNINFNTYIYIYMRYQIQKLLTQTYKHHCFIVKSLFTHQQCLKLLQQNIFNKQNTTKFQNAINNYPTYYRNNQRYVVDNEKLAQQLYNKIVTYLPKQLQIQQGSFKQQGKWHVKCLNQKIRFCRYRPNQYFNKHLDGIHYRSSHLQSKLTFMVYLNTCEGNFKGGKTLFYNSYQSQQVIAQYVPHEGDLIIFDHNLWHKGQMVVSGEKFIMRSDIIYEKQSNKNVSQDDIGWKSHFGYIWSLLLWKDDILISGGRDKSIKIWKDNTCISSIKAHNNSVLDFIKLNQVTLVSCSRDKTIKIWKLQNQTLKQQIQIKLLPTQTPISLLKLTSQLFACGCTDGKIRIYKSSGQLLTILQGHQNWVWKLQKISQNIFISCSQDSTIRIWDYNFKKQLSKITHQCSIHSIIFLQKQNQIIAGDLKGNLIKFSLDRLTYKIKHEKTYQKAHGSIIRSIHYIHDSIIATGSQDCYVKLWNINKFQQINKYKHENFVQDITSNGQYLYSSSYDGKIIRKNIKELLQ